MAASSLGRPGLEAYSSFSAPLYSFPPLMEAGDMYPPDGAVTGFVPDLDDVLPPPPDDQYSLPPAMFSGGGSVTGGNNDLEEMAMEMMSGGGSFPFPATPPLPPPSCYYHHCCGNHNNNKGGEKEELERSRRIGFRTRSAVEVMEDGFRWRKYGKKAVKSSPNLRNYYRCSAPGCGVKKRVERDRHDPAYVITTYHGVHNHLTPGTT